MNYITRLNILLRLTSPDTIFVLYAEEGACALMGECPFFMQEDEARAGVPFFEKSDHGAHCQKLSVEPLLPAVKGGSS